MQKVCRRLSRDWPNRFSVVVLLQSEKETLPDFFFRFSGVGGEKRVWFGANSLVLGGQWVFKVVPAPQASGRQDLMVL